MLKIQTGGSRPFKRLTRLPQERLVFCRLRCQPVGCALQRCLYLHNGSITDTERMEALKHAFALLQADCIRCSVTSSSAAMWNAQHAPLSAMPMLASSFSIGKVLKVFRINSLLRSDNTPQFFSFAKEEFGDDTRVLQCGKHISGKHCPTSVIRVFPNLRMF